MEPIVEREAGRVLLLDPADRVLLLQYVRANGERYWATPGGGLREDEGFERAARRELEEEVGVRVQVLRFLWAGETWIDFGGRRVRQREQFFLARVDDAAVIEGSALEDVRMQEGIVAHCWWTLADLERGEARVFPDELAVRLRAVLAH
jgi:ADP-ribose pyrophosphatase YjhB (NUDIX family)